MGAIRDWHRRLSEHESIAGWSISGIWEDDRALNQRTGVIELQFEAHTENRMQVLFHTVPERMVGTVLYPLNELEDIDPKAWRREREKYAGRDQVLEMCVPPLHCLWNDVLHLSAVHPADIIAALGDVGLEPLRRRFFEIDPFELDVDRTVVFVNHHRASAADALDESQWMPFKPDALTGLSTFNEASRRYYRECAQVGTQAFAVGIPSARALSRPARHAGVADHRPLNCGGRLTCARVPP